MKKRKTSRTAVLQGVFILLFAVLLYRLWFLQVVKGEQYSENLEQKLTRTLKEESARGNIYDRNGEILASNQLVYTVTMSDSGSYASNRERQLALNGMIRNIQKKLRDNGEEIYNELKITVSSEGTYEYTVEEKALSRFKADIFGEADPGKMTAEQAEMKAEEMIRYLTGNDKFALYGEGDLAYEEEEMKTYGLQREYEKEEVLEIIGIRYMLSLNSFRRYQSVTIAKDISPETMAYVTENNEKLTGIDIGEEWERVYHGGEAFAHILGYTGEISVEELEALGSTDDRYAADSIVGKIGIEQYMEEELQGTDGRQEFIVNYVGKMVGEPKTVQEAARGNDVYLTIDKELQMAVYEILEQNLAGILSSNLINAKEFDKSNISDTANIRIPVYDVYLALVRNEIIKIDRMYQPEASALEQKSAASLSEKRRAVLEEVRTELLENGAISFDLSKEMKEYERFIVEESGIFKEGAIDKKDSVYLSWSREGTKSLRELLHYAIEAGWADAAVFDSQNKYYTVDEIYELLVADIMKTLGESKQFEKIVFCHLILEDGISGKEICELLYEQEVLSKEDADYQGLAEGTLEPFLLIKRKIENLMLTPAQLALDPCSGSAVVVQKETGKVLASVTYPGYDNNRLANRIDRNYYQQLLNDRSLPLYNRATQQLTAPGSTFKPVTIVAGIQEGVITADTAVFCDGVFDKVTPNLRCWKHVGHGEIANASSAIQNSCNDYLCEISYRLGMEGTAEYNDDQAISYLQEYAALFDLDKKSGIEVEESAPKITDAYGIPSAIGQGTHNYTTVQLARYVNTIASEGDSFSLSLIGGVKDTDGTLHEKVPELASRVELPDGVWDTVEAGMRQFAQNNAIIKDMKIDVSGKTGTAQEVKTRPDHSLFVGFAPAHEPEISIAVRIANGYGSSNATAVGRDVFNYYFELENRDEIITGRASQTSNTSSD